MIKHILFYLVLAASSAQGQLTKLGAEIISRQSFTHGKFEVRLSPSEKEGYITSFILLGTMSQPTVFKFDLSKAHSQCYFVLDKKYMTQEFNAPVGPAIYSIAWTPASIQYKVDSTVLMEVALGGADISSCRALVTLWQDAETANLYTEPDTTLAELDYYAYYSLDTSLASGFKLQQEDSFEKLKPSLWHKSRASYPENSFQNDTNMLFIEQDKLQLICLSYRSKPSKGFFKRDVSVQKIKKPIKAEYQLLKGKPVIIVQFRDSIYRQDKHSNLFEITDNKVLKSKLRADYKTVVLYLQKPLDKSIRLTYFPILGRFRKPQFLEVSYSQ